MGLAALLQPSATMGGRTRNSIMHPQRCTLHIGLCLMMWSNFVTVANLMKSMLSSVDHYHAPQCILHIGLYPMMGIGAGLQQSQT